LASANPGQAVTLTGSGLSTSTGVIMTYTGSDGIVRTVLVNPTAAAANGGDRHGGDERNHDTGRRTSKTPTQAADREPID